MRMLKVLLVVVLVGINIFLGAIFFTVLLGAPHLKRDEVVITGTVIIASYYLSDNCTELVSPKTLTCI